MSPVISGITRTYDFGDDWTHLIALESTHGAAADSPRAVCVAGQRRGPIEDSGGPRGYQEVLDAVGDPSHQRHREASEWLTFIGNSLTDDLIDQSKINDEIAAALTLHPAAASDQLKQLINRCQGLEPRDRLTQLITAARLDVPITIDPETAKAMVQPYCWLLQRVGPNGIKLTKAGFLPPIHVKAAVDELGVDNWIGAGTREDSTPPRDLATGHGYQAGAAPQASRRTESHETRRGAGGRPGGPVGHRRLTGSDCALSE